MAEILVLLAAIAGVSTSGLQVAKLLYSSVRFTRRLEDETRSAAREVEALSSVFEEISTVLQSRTEASATAQLTLSRTAIATIADILKDSQSLYDKIGTTVKGSVGSKVVSLFIMHLGGCRRAGGGLSIL